MSETKVAYAHARMFPDPAAPGLGILAEGGTVRVLSIDAWQMQTMREP